MRCFSRPLHDSISEPWIYYRAVHALAPGAVTSVGVLPHHELLVRLGSGWVLRWSALQLPSLGLNTPSRLGSLCRMTTSLTCFEWAKSGLTVHGLSCF